VKLNSFRCKRIPRIGCLLGELGSLLVQRKVLLISLCMVSGCQTAPEKWPIRETFQGVPFEYHTSRLYSEKEKAHLLELATQCGMNNIDKVVVNVMLPSSAVAASINAPEVISDRRFSHRYLLVEFRSHVSESLRNFKEFAVTADEVEKLTVLRVGGDEFRVRVDEAIPASMAEDILNRIYRKAINFPDAHTLLRTDTYECRELERYLKEGHPTSIEMVDSETYKVTFWEGGSGARYEVRRDAGTGALHLLRVWMINV